jgi:hypothetical protein
VDAKNETNSKNESKQIIISYGLFFPHDNFILKVDFYNGRGIVHQN